MLRKLIVALIAISSLVLVVDMCAMNTGDEQESKEAADSGYESKKYSAEVIDSESADIEGVAGSMWAFKAMCLAVDTYDQVLDKKIKIARALLSAVDRGDVKTVREALQKGLNVNKKYDLPYWILLRNARRGCLKARKHLLRRNAFAAEKAGALQSKANSSESKAYVFKNGDYDGDSAFFIESKVGRRIRSHYGETLLIKATRNKDKNMVKMLLDQNSDVNTIDRNHNTPLLIAIFGDESGIITMMLEKEADVNATNKDQEFALFRASFEGKIDTVRLLLAHGSAINQVAWLNTTSLMAASRKGHVEVVCLLLEHKADTNMRYVDGKTALMFAADEGHRQIAALLLEGKADPTLCDKEGNTTWSLATPEMSELLMTAWQAKHGVLAE